jgi:tellurite resistance protein TerC
MNEVLSIASVGVLGTPAWAWMAFFAIVVALVAFDLGILNKHDHEIGIAESLWLSAGYFAVACLFGFGVLALDGTTPAVEYFTGFLIEKSLSLDNIFVISLIFGYFAIPRRYQHRVLFWGIVGVIVLRGIMIAAGAALVHRFEWMLLVFGAFLVITGVRMLMTVDETPDIAQNRILKVLRRRLRVTERIDGYAFFVRRPDASGRLVAYATPLFLALVLVETADLVFAVDSIPAIFAITQDPFIVYTSNIFAILGLRALYFALAAMISRFHYLKYALSAVLVLIGGKIFYSHFFDKVDPLVSLAATVGILGAGVAVSLLRPPPREGAAAREGERRA